MFLLFLWGGFAIFGLMSRLTVLSFLALSFRRAGGSTTELEDILLSVDDLALIKFLQLLLILDCRQFILMSDFLSGEGGDEGVGSRFAQCRITMQL